MKDASLILLSVAALVVPAQSAIAQEDPPLPSGLEASGPEEEPAEDKAPDDPPPRPGLPFDFAGFADLRAGTRTHDATDQKRTSLGEARYQIELGRQFETADLSLRLVGDLIIDPVLEVYEPDLEKGEGAIDLREANFALSPTDSIDLKVGRQPLTWGTGDLIFINDLFPKDWTAFLIGRDIEYLKAPSDAIKLSVFHEIANFDVVFTPRFDSDRFPDRRRLSSWDPQLMEIAGSDRLPTIAIPDRWFRDSEIALRLHRRVASYELALYAYRGFWKSPAAFDPVAGSAFSPELAVYGASARTPLVGGIASMEVGFNHSLDDRDGDDPLVRNSELRLLAGYEHEVAPNLTASAQYYIEHMFNHDDYRAGLPSGSPVADETRHLLSSRLTLLMASQRVRLSLFVFYSPSDQDAYLRPTMGYQLDDHWNLQAGANIFEGRQDHTFFGQFEEGSNVYAGVTYSF